MEDSNTLQEIFNQSFWISYDCQHVLPIFKQIVKETAEQKIGHEILVKALCQELFVLLIREFTSISTTQKKYHDADLNHNRQLIIDEMFFLHSDTITLESLAERLECSPRHVSRYINLYYGKSFHELKNDFRMASAAAKLHDLDKPIRNISEELGYSSYDYFDRVFKKYFSLSPTDYRQQLQKSETN
ncbi:MAG: helix-turn-helix domain-containing protein [Lachnospiraceae bacterium]